MNTFAASDLLVKFNCFSHLETLDAEYPYSPVTNQMWERGRARLQNYLKEIGWTETIIDVRSKCTRNLLKLGNEQEENINPNVNGGEGNNKRASESQGKLSNRYNVDKYVVTFSSLFVWMKVEASRRKRVSHK